MKRTSVTDAGRLDRQILTAMITSTRFLREVADIYSPEFLPGDYARTVADWCRAHYERYKEAPGRHIQDYYDRAIRERLIADKGQLELIERFLAGISAEYDASLNIDFLLDETEKWWARRNLEHLSEDIRETIASASDPREAEDLLRQHVAVNRTGHDGFNPFRDIERLRRALDEVTEPLLMFGGALGQMVNRYMVREALIGLMGPEKRGKSFWLAELLLRACLAKRNVALFEVGDMTESQLLRRVFSRLSGMPPSPDDCGESLIPECDCLHNQTDTCVLPCRKVRGICVREEGNTAQLDADVVPPEYRACTECRNRGDRYVPEVLYRRVNRPNPLDTESGQVACTRMLRRMGNRELQVSIHPNFSINVRGLMDILDRWKERQGFVPDVVVIDYADILSPERSGLDERTAQNERWALLRQMSQRYHCLVVAATQTNRESYTAETITEDMSSEDKRKLAHVVGMLGLHRHGDERERKVMRLSWILHRETRLSVWDQVVSLMDLDVCNPHVDSYWRPRKPQKSAKSVS